MIVPVTLSQNKSPVIHVSHNISLESWCVKYIYNYAYQKLFEYRKLVSRMKLLEEDSRVIRRLLLGTLLINPEVVTFWNMRRELLIGNYLNINTELKISKLILTHKSKSMETFSYRKWCLSRMLNTEIHNKNWVDNILTEELKVCDMSAQKNQNNYHSWCHRIWSLENMASISSNLGSVLKHELNYSENWISLHVSEHTGFHYRQYVISKIRNIEVILDSKYVDCINNLFDNVANQKNVRDVLIYIFGSTEQIWNEINVSLMYNSVALLLYELLLNEELNYMYQDHEAIWYHRRYVLYNLFCLILSYFGFHSKNITTFVPNYDIDSNIVNSYISSYVPNEKIDFRGKKYPKINCDFNVVHSSNLYKLLCRREKSLITKFSKKSSERNLDLAKRHEKWLRFVLGITEV